ncbi:MAG: aldehyde ferredoxin oxidoreductase C-terminal domain-containing protein, partial [Anaerolineae bacterium]|nr:aldehyde ferredoxin oxidoreductase C-terminal domain-containing protein [Anaerolineae bacterium]
EKWLGLDPDQLSRAEKINAHRAYRLQQYEHLIDAVYLRRGWSSNGIPTVKKLQSLGIDYPEVIAVIRNHS